MTSTDDDALFKALADPTRRALLDALFEVDGQTLGRLCAQHPQLTRFGVAKHLAVLEAAGLVVTLRVGREKRHHLNPVPITAIAARWVGKFAQPYAEALVELKSDLERGAASASATTSASASAAATTASASAATTAATASIALTASLPPTQESS
jgi:DNA-binding transcriptional ArsR family regulator